MADGMNKGFGSTNAAPRVRRGTWHALVGTVLVTASLPGLAAINCERNVTANVVALDQPLMYNRLGAQNINGMMYALQRDVIVKGATAAGGTLTPGNVELRPDKRPRPLVLRVRVGDCLTVNLTNLLAPAANPNNLADVINPATGLPEANPLFVDGQVRSRFVGFSVSGMQAKNNINDVGIAAGGNTVANTLAAVGQKKTYTLYAEKEGVFLAQSYGATIGGDANQGNSSNGLFGQVIVEPSGAKIYRSILTEEEMRLAADANNDGILQADEKTTGSGHPKINYDKLYPPGGAWTAEGKAGLPILNMMNPPDAGATSVEIVHSDLEAMIVGPNADGTFPPSTYPLESMGKRNPTVPNRLEPFRDFAQVWHDEPNAGQAFPGFYADPVFKYVLAGVKDGFMINYGSGGIGSEIIANRLGVGPMHDCLDCSYEEFFLTSFTVGDPALLVDIPANVGLEFCTPADAAALVAAVAAGKPIPAGNACAALGPKAGAALYPADPINVHHSYIGDFVKFRNTHIGKEQHVFHLHNHQWLYNPNDDNSNYLDAQGIGPGIGYTYEINFGGSGNRNKSAGDAIFHCHFYPHFAQGMWYHWRHYDTFEQGTQLTASQTATGYHESPFELRVGVPANGSRALPDGEIAVGVPLAAIVPLPGKPMAPVPGEVKVVANPLMKPHGITGAPVSVGSVAQVIDRNKNPGYPFWIAGIDVGAGWDGTPEKNMSIVGQRPPTPVLDMLNPAQANALKTQDPALFAKLIPTQADGWDGGLPRHALRGYVAGGRTELNVVTARDFTKVIAAAEPVFYPEGGTDIERLAMAFHKKGQHPTSALSPTGGELTGKTFITNGVGPVIGAPYHEPCRDDRTGDPAGHLIAGAVGQFFSGETINGMSTRGQSAFNASSPRIYKGANIQFDVVLNKVGYHYPQQRIITLWEDAVPVILKQQPPEPLVMRLNTFDCAVYSHTNLVPEYFEMDDYQVRTPTDIIGQHIHLPKWDLTTTDGAANGWNYEDGTFSPGAVRERIHAINERNVERMCEGLPPVLPTDPLTNVGYTQPRTVNVSHTCPVGSAVASVNVPELQIQAHPYFGQFAVGQTPTATGQLWGGARTTMQRWFADPVVNTDGVDRGLGIIFTHDHYGPSTHQQIGLYATVLTQPAGSTWVHNETGTPLGAGPNGSGGRMDGGPTSWQAQILPPTAAPANVTTQPQTVAAFREFYFEFSDFQHAYEKGAYVGADPNGVPLPALATFPDAGIGEPGPNPRINRVLGVPGGLGEAFRVAINPPARQQISPLYPDLVLEVIGGIIPGCPARPCPQAIDVQDPGMFAVNYRNEPIALRVFDPNKLAPDQKRGMQADGIPGDLAFATASRIMDKSGVVTPITRVIPELNKTEAELGYWAKTLNAPTATLGGDPFTPMMRAYAGDLVRMKIQAGGHEEEHNATILGLKWLQGGSGHGKQPNSGWRNSQAAGISEQFTLAIPMFTPVGTVKGTRDYVYNVDSSMDGWWSGTWGLMRTYDTLQADLKTLPNNTNVTPDRINNRRDFAGVCPVNARPNNITVIAILANDLLPTVNGVTIVPAGTAAQHVGADTLNANGGTLVYNPRPQPIAGLPAGEGGVATPPEAGPLHDPTAMLYVDSRDVEVDPTRGGTFGKGACKDSNGQPAVANAQCPIRMKPGRKVEPLVIRANADDCVNLTVFNRLPALAPDLPTLATLQGVNKRDRVNGQGSIAFDNNLIRASSHVGIVPQLVAVDVMSHLGMNVGGNVTQTVPPVDATGKSGKGTYTWYAGDLAIGSTAAKGVNVAPTPVEFGGFGLSPADKVKQGQKSLVGGMVVAPKGATVTVDATTRAQATVVAGATTFRDFMLVMQKDTNQRYASGNAVPHINGEGVGIPEDSQENSGMALNYGIEPLWFRFGIAPNAPFGGPGSFADVDAEQAYTNALAGGLDPVTPVFKVSAGTEARIHSAVPHGTSRGTTLTFYGHVWQRDPYVCEGESRNGLGGACNMGTVGSRGIGSNPLGFAQGAQESITPLSHFTYRFPKAGGANEVTGDYLFRDAASFGNASGLWGILRVDPKP